MAADLQSTLTASETGHVYRFGKGLDGNAALTRGWGEPERGFVWSEGRAAVVILPALPGENTLAINLWGYVPNGMTSQDTLVFINGCLSGYFEIGEKITVRVSHNNTTSAESLEILFYIPSATSPLQAEGSSDKRRLGLALAVIQLDGKISLK